MLFTLVLFAVTISIILMVMALVIKLVGVATGKVASDTKDPTSNVTDHKDLWYYFGFVSYTNNAIWAIVSGSDEENGPIKEYRSNLRNRIWDPSIRKVRDLRPNENPFGNESKLAKFIRLQFGKFFYGIPFLTSAKPLYIDRVTRKLTADKNSKLADQLEASDRLVKKYWLYGEFPRPTYHADIDLGEGFRINVISYAEIVVDDPEPAFTKYKDSFLQTISDYIATFVSSRLINMGWDEYKKDRETGEKFKDLGPLNDVLRPLGVRVIALPFSDPEITEESKQLQEALQLQKIGKEKGRAAVAEAEGLADAQRLKAKGMKDASISIAEGEAEATWIKGEAQAQVIERVAKANGMQIAEFYRRFQDGAFSDAEAMRMATELIQSGLNAEAVGKLTGVYAPGGGAPVQLSVPVKRESVMVPAGEK